MVFAGLFVFLFFFKLGFTAVLVLVSIDRILQIAVWILNQIDWVSYTTSCTTYLLLLKSSCVSIRRSYLSCEKLDLGRWAWWWGCKTLLHYGTTCFDEILIMAECSKNHNSERRWRWRRKPGKRFVGRNSKCKLWLKKTEKN